MSDGRHLVVILVLASSVARGDVGAAQASSSIDEVIEWLDPLYLEEIPAALHVQPRLAIDPSGGFLVTDRAAFQVRVYDASGSLITHFGRAGDGPGEFRDLRAVARLVSGELCTVDFRGRLAVWSSNGELVRDFRLPIRGAMGLSVVDASRIALVLSPVVADPDSLRVPRVQLVDIESQSLAEQVLSWRLTRENVSLTSTVEGELNPTLGRRFGLTWATSDSLWTVDLDGVTSVRVVGLQSDLLGINTRPIDRFEREAFVEWMLTATFPGAVFPISGEGWLVNVFKRRRGGGYTYGLLRVDVDGRSLWEIEDGLRLVATDPSQGILYFEEKSGLEPGRFERARLRN